MENEIRILLAEDEQVIALTLEDALVDGGYAVSVASTGEDALSRLAVGAAELSGLITDIRLGGTMDGWEIARMARQANPTIAVVYMTGDSAADYSAQGVPDSLILQKPFASAQMLTAISTLLNKAVPQPE
ncbi:response regulator [Sphingomonas oligophenolica]|uniref:Response regulator n=1 Tax=Sphingomonas oligophenolica TaxID=301154 RepID=A0ABU9Y9Q8_9SPHN